MIIIFECFKPNLFFNYMILKPIQLFSIAILLSISTPLVAQIKMPERGLCAHRGCMNTHPENTLPAFQEAIRLGAHMIEFDIQFTKDSIPVLMHDETVDRTTNGTGKVSDLTFSKIRQLDAGIKKSPDFQYTAVPTFEEILKMMPRNIWLNCHLKGDGIAGAKIARIIERAGRTHQAFITCGETAAKSAREAVPTILICNVEGSYRKNAALYVSNTIQLKANFLQFLVPEQPEDRAPLLRELHQNGVKANYYHAKDVSELKGLYEAGIDFVLVNDLNGFMKESEVLGVPPVNQK